MSWAPLDETAEAPPPLPAQPPARHGGHALLAGLRLALLARPRLAGLPLTIELFWLAALLQFALAFALDWAFAETPRQFDALGIASAAQGRLLDLLLAWLISRRLQDRELLWPAACLILLAGLPVGVLSQLVQELLLPRLVEAGHPWEQLSWGLFALTCAWWLLILVQLCAVLQPAAPAGRRATLALLCVALSALSGWGVPSYALWSKDYAAAYDAEEASRPEPLVAEAVFAQQPALLQQALAPIRRGVAGRPELYFVAFGPYGSQEVFRREVEYSERLFRERFGAAGRTLTLANHRSSVGRLPLATVTNLGQALREIGTRMNREEDILFLFLTSHGSQDARLSVELEDLSFLELSADTLARLLRESGIRWRVLVVSGCYSGSFIDQLKDEHTLLITAARADRVSFGCTDGNEFTEFGRAYFEQALNRSTSFTEAFAIAQERIHERETLAEETPSEPQIVVGGRIEAQLAAWRAGLAPLPPPLKP